MRKNKATSSPNGISILMVDDDETITLALQTYFQSSGYEVETDNNPIDAIELMRQRHYDILLLDYLMSPICGDEVVERVREFDKDIYIIFLTGHKNMVPPIKTIRELEIQGYFEKSNRFDQLELLVESCVKSIRQMKQIKAYQQGLKEKNEKLDEAYRTMHENYVQMLMTLRSTVDAKDIYTRGHSDRVSFFAEKIGMAMGVDEDMLRRLKVGGLFHDIGKIAIADAILQKPGKITDEEYAEIKKHPVYGERILSAVTQLHDILPIVRGHHERIDGAGYPDGIKGDQIPLETRIITVADAFDAMMSTRRYRDGLELSEVLQELEACKGKQFDGEIVDAFVNLLNTQPDLIQECENYELFQNRSENEKFTTKSSGLL